MLTQNYQTMEEIPYLAVSNGGGFALVLEQASLIVCLKQIQKNEIRENIFYILAAYPKHIPVIVYDSFSEEAAQKLTEVIYAVEGVVI